jgi:D-psicose/D-tagatose/L-ribulose 3-epimerase
MRWSFNEGGIMNKVGIYFAYWTDSWTGDFKYYVDKVARLGFDILEVQPDQLLEVPRVELDSLRQLASDRGIELTYCIGFSQDKDLASESASVRRAGMDYARKILEIIHIMDGKVFCGINYSAWPGTYTGHLTDKRPYLERSIQCVKEISKVAEDYDIMYCLEIVNRFEHFLLNTAVEGLAYLEAVGSPNVKLLLDAFHMNIEEDNMSAAIVSVGDKLGHFHIGETNRRLPGQGRMPWDEISQALKQINYQGRVVMEPFVKPGGEVGEAIRVWRDLSDGADEAQLDRDAQGALTFIRGKLA